MTADALLCNSRPLLVELLSECAGICASMRPELLPDAESKLAEAVRLFELMPAEEKPPLLPHLKACGQLAESANSFWERRAALVRLDPETCTSADRRTSILA